MNNKETYIKLVKQWLYHNSKCREINKYLYEHTEFFENQTMLDYAEEQFNFFAGKITRYTKDENRLKETLTAKQLIDLKMEELFN